MSGNPRLTQAAYQALPGGVLDLDKSFYDQVAKTAESGERKLLESFILPIRSGRAWKVPKGTVCSKFSPSNDKNLSLLTDHSPHKRTEEF